MPAENVVITVYVECESCKHKWTVERPSPLLAKRDRRGGK
jgi:hypothetical protein